MYHTGGLYCTPLYAAKGHMTIQYKIEKLEIFKVSKEDHGEVEVEMSDRYRGAQPLTQFEQVGRICLWWETPSHSEQQEGGGEKRNTNG